MRRLILVFIALLAGSAFATSAAQADPPDYFPYECHAFVQCTIYAPNGDKVISYAEVREAVDGILP
jgi:hypothetical protein